MNKKHNKLMDQLEEALAKIAGLEAKLFDKDNELLTFGRGLTAERDRVHKENERLTAENKALTTDRDEMIKKLADLRSEAASKHRQLVEMNDKLIRHNGKLQQCFDAAMELVEQLRRD